MKLKVIGVVNLVLLQCICSHVHVDHIKKKTNRQKQNKTKTKQKRGPHVIKEKNEDNTNIYI